MAIVTKNLGSSEGTSWELDYDDNSLKLKTIRCINTMTGYVAIGVFKSQADPTFQYIIEVTTAQSPFEQAIPVNVQNKYNIGIDARGRLTGVDYEFRIRPA
jgi:hypothetical protein